jgi:hypothetical protein
LLLSPAGGADLLPPQAHNDNTIIIASNIDIALFTIKPPFTAYHSLLHSYLFLW